MDSSVYREIKREYDIKRQRAIEKSKLYKEKIYSENSILEKIEDGDTSWLPIGEENCNSN